MIENITLEELKNLIANAQSEKVIKDLLDLSIYRKSEYRIDNQISKEILLLSSRFNTVSSKNREGVISDADFQLELNKVNSALIQIIEKIESRIGNLEPSKKEVKKNLWILSLIIGTIAITVIYLIVQSQQGLSDPIVNKEENIDNPVADTTLKNNPGISSNQEALKFAELAEPSVLPKENRDVKVNPPKGPANLQNSEPVKFEEKKLNEEDGKKLKKDLNSIFFRTSGSTYAVYVEGKQITGSGRTKGSYSEDDLIVYDTETGITYFLPNYVNSKDGKLRAAEILFKGQKVVFRTSGSTYAVYVEGKKITGSGRTKGSYSGDDLIVYDTETGITYFLPNYVNSKDGKLRVAKVLKDD